MLPPICQFVTGYLTIRDVVNSFTCFTLRVLKTERPILNAGMKLGNIGLQTAESTKSTVLSQSAAVTRLENVLLTI